MDLEDLEQMTSEAIELFRKGQQQAALDLAVDFSKNAEMLLGRSHPVNVNALATVAALAEQMGCRREAEELLQEAEELHQEMEGRRGRE
ncbi:snRNP core protein D2 [Durusdinium trenchii]|uniref:SnRNP core protein D2 n=1 Tax=Durusdinium trenchii TaxID=1381693 RepID=A0ABP0QI93_9DINO